VGVVVDTGFQGMKHPSLFIPQNGNKKRRLNPEVRASNSNIRSWRIVAEYASGGMKRYGATSQVLCNKIGRFDNQVSLVSAGLWNHHVTTQAANQN